MSEEEKKKKEALNQEWKKWRENIEKDIKGIQESLTSQNKPESKSFETFMTSHVPGCPECQGILEKIGYKKQEKKEEKSKKGSEKPGEQTPEKAQKEEWSAESMFSEEEN